MPDALVEHISFEIVNKSQDTARLVMGWRNDPETLSQSFHQEPKVWPGFYDEFAGTYFVDPSLPCLFALEGGKRVGFLRFRRIEHPVYSRIKTCDISIMVAPEHRGRGLGQVILQAVMPLVKGMGIESVLSEVKVNNEKSVVMFQRAGFQLFDEHSHYVSDTGETVRVKRLFFHLVESFEVSLAESSNNQQTANKQQAINCQQAINKQAVKIGPGHPCFVIAEAGSNWRMGTRARDMSMAKTLIDVAVEAGADAVKFQTYRAETTYVANAGDSDYLSEAGIKESISEIFQDLAMPYEMIAELAQHCQKQGILFMSSPFSLQDFKAVDPYVQIHKIASYEISHLRLIEAAAVCGKPLILSTGASNMDDITWAVDYFKSQSRSNLCLMQCTARYPASYDVLNLNVIPHLKTTFGVPVGLSDHSRDHLVGPAAAVALGANAIEKHYTLDNRLPGPDHAFAINAEELKAMVKAIRETEEALGHGIKQVLDAEEELYYYARRGLQAIKEIGIGEAFVEGKNFDILRPGKQKRGIHPKSLLLVGKSKATRAIRLGEGIQEGDFVKA